MLKQEDTKNNTSVENRLRNNIGDAKEKWGKITKAEFSDLDGSSSELAKLVGNRYNIKYEDAEKQVRQFLDSH